MKLYKKVIINGKEYFEEVEDDDKSRDDVSDNETKDGSSEKKHKSKININDFSDFASWGKNLANSIKDSFSKSFGSDNPKTRKLIKMLPFMDEDDIHDLYEKIMEDDKLREEIDVTSLFPYLDEDDIDELFSKACKDGDARIIKKAAPFVSDEVLDDLVEAYIAGKLPDLDIDSLYPFLDSNTVKKLIYYEINRE